MKNQLKMLPFSLKLKTPLKKEDIVTFDEKSMILNYDKCTEEGVIWGKYTYICRQMDNLETKK